jgi:hypothetical protein
MIGALPARDVGADFTNQRQSASRFDAIDPCEVNTGELVQLGARIEARLVMLGRLTSFRRWRWALICDTLQAR